jgi:hypothetical protein
VVLTFKQEESGDMEGRDHRDPRGFTFYVATALAIIDGERPCSTGAWLLLTYSRAALLYLS